MPCPGPLHAPSLPPTYCATLKPQVRRRLLGLSLGDPRDVSFCTVLASPHGHVGVGGLHLHTLSHIDLSRTSISLDLAYTVPSTLATHATAWPHIWEGCTPLSIVYPHTPHCISFATHPIVGSTQACYLSATPARYLTSRLHLSGWASSPLGGGRWASTVFYPQGVSTHTASHTWQTGYVG